MNIEKRLFDSRTKEEKERDFEMYASQIFPYGDEQKNTVKNLLKEAFPGVKIQYLMMHYILIKQEFLDGTGKTVEEACASVEKKKVVKITPELKQAIRRLLPIDLNITEELSYPTSEALKN